MAKLYDRAINMIVNELDKDAKVVLRECVNERTYEHQTYNLYDSYGYGIYVNGSLRKKGYLSSSPRATESKKWYGEEIKGREQIDEFLNRGYQAGGLIDLAVVATMPYAKVLEAGTGLHHSYRVISMSFQKLQELKYKYNGIVKAINQ